MKQSIKRLEIPISKFNDVAVPHHLSVLKSHKDNIIKYQRMKDWEKSQKEQINAQRVVKQLEQLLYEMDTLRSQVEDNDIEKFDKLTSKSRSLIIIAVQEYLAMKFEVQPTNLPLKPSTEDGDDDSDLLSSRFSADDKYLQLQKEQGDFERQKACLHAWNSLQNDMQQLHQLFVDFNKLIEDQREQIDRMEDEVIESEVNIQVGAKNLEKASKLKVAAYPIAGALIGTCIGGPVGLVAGLKLGGLAAVGCGILGFTGATFLKKKQLESLKQTDETDGIKLSQRGLKKEL